MSKPRGYRYPAGTSSTSRYPQRYPQYPGLHRNLYSRKRFSFSYELSDNLQRSVEISSRHMMLLGIDSEPRERWTRLGSMGTRKHCTSCRRAPAKLAFIWLRNNPLEIPFASRQFESPVLSWPMDARGCQAWMSCCGQVSLMKHFTMLCMFRPGGWHMAAWPACAPALLVCLAPSYRSLMVIPATHRHATPCCGVAQWG